MQERRVKGSAEAQSQVASRSLQVAGHKSQVADAVRSTQSQEAQVDAVAKQTLTLEGNECFFSSKYRRVYIQKVCDYVPNDPEHIRDVLLYFPTSSCANRTHPCWRATAMWSATNRDLRSRRRVDF